MYHYRHENPGKGDTLIFLDRTRKLGAAILIDGREERPIHLTLQPTGTVSGRLVDEQGHPRAHVLLEVWAEGKRNGNRWQYNHGERVLSGDDGAFVITNVLPEIPYRVDVTRTNFRSAGPDREGYLKASRWSLKPGEAVNWGSIRTTTTNR